MPGLGSDEGALEAALAFATEIGCRSEPSAPAEPAWISRPSQAAAAAVLGALGP
jgi:hypothetical protein